MATPPTIDYGRPDPRKKTSLATATALALIVILPLAYIVLEPPRSRVPANQSKCANNLRQIGQAILLYSQDYAGCYPPDLQAAFSTQPISTEVVICPNTWDQKASTPAGLGQPGRCSYIYTGAGLDGQSNPECVVAIEDPANHDLRTCHALFGDGHVESLTLPVAMQTLNDLAAGMTPPRTSTNLTEPLAKQDYDKNWRARMAQMKMGVWHVPTTLPATLLKSERGQ